MKSCDLVLKGGVASGLVYGPLIARLASIYQFQGLAGASAGAMAAALAAAAEYGRKQGDVNAFDRLNGFAEEIATNFTSLFQPSKPFRALFKAVIHLAPGSFRPRWARALLCISAPFVTGLLFGAGITGLLQAVTGIMPDSASAWPGLITGAMLGIVVGGLGWLGYIINLAATQYNFGVCTGLGAPGRLPALTLWLNNRLQDLSGSSGLTFGDLKTVDIDLRVVTTNLSLGRLHILPEFDVPLWFSPSEWERLFPPVVMQRLADGQIDNTAAYWQVPAASDMPVIVAVRMSMACPGLLEQVPVYATPKGGTRLYLSDGGLGLNFPFDVFAREDRSWPSFAVDLDTLRDGDPMEDRVFTMADELRQKRLAADTIDSPFSFIWALFNVMREAHIRTEMRRSSHPDRLFRIALTRTEGGMNLSMTPQEIHTLMSHGNTAARRIVESHGDKH